MQNSHSGLPYLGLPYHDSIPMVHLSIARYANPHTPLERAQCCSMSCHPACGMVRQGHGEVRSELQQQPMRRNAAAAHQAGCQPRQSLGGRPIKILYWRPLSKSASRQNQDAPSLKLLQLPRTTQPSFSVFGGCGTKQKLHGRWVRQGHDGHAASLGGSGSPGGRHQLSSSIRIVKTFTQKCQMGAGCPHKPKLEEHIVD